jgi:hypothetical protein
MLKSFDASLEKSSPFRIEDRHLLTSDNCSRFYTHLREFIYSHAPHNDVSVNDGPHIRRWYHKHYNIIILTTVTDCMQTNDSIRRELQTECILDKTDEYRRNWILHLQRMPQNRIPLKSYHYRSQGKRTIARPKKRWREQL